MSENGRKVVEVPSSVTVRQLADLIDASPIDVIKHLMSNGVMANINQQIDFDTAAIVMHEFGIEALPEVPPAPAAADEGGAEAPEWRRLVEREDPAALVIRPPVVTVLGHVDHGKTSLLDAIRQTDVAAGEAGGITQHVGAYQVKHHDRWITFLDTPGHAAFTAMRARGAQVTDIAVLVVAADDGVMPQTREAVAHARAARVPIIVAVNKIDRPNANPDRVKQQLAEIGLTADDWGGDTLVVPVSAKQRKGIDDLLESILLVADSSPIRANPAGQVLGTVIEASLDKSKGPLATLLVQNGTLHVGNVLVAGTAYGKVRNMYDFHGKPIDEAAPSIPASVLGLSKPPQAGDLFRVVSSEREARAIVEGRKQEQRQAAIKPQAAVSLDQVFAKFQAGETKELRLIVKADVQGSLEPVVNSLRDLPTAGGPQLNILYSETGNVTENDVMLASASDAIIVGFNVAADAPAQRLAEQSGVSIRLYEVIYRLTEEIAKALKGLLGPEMREVVIGRAEVRQVFRIPKIGHIAGCSVREGELRRNARMRVVRGGQFLFEGEVASLRREKDDVRDVQKGQECGVALKDFDAFKPGDVLEAVVKEQVE